MNSTLENCPLTLNTTRICSNDSMDIAIEISKIGFNSMKPNAIILVNKNEVFDGIAATSLIHFPINASLLFTDGNSLSKETLKEIQRLSPKGYKGTQVILVGSISQNVSSELNDYGFRTHHIAGRNHYETACMIARAMKEFKNILIMSGDEYDEGIVAGYWSAHHGDPILFVKNDKIPVCALEVIKKKKDINIYIIGSTKTVSKNVEQYLSQLDNVKHLDRIDGDNPYEIAVNFAKYKDPKTEFGWGRNYREGHAFTFGQLSEPMEIIAGVLFAHMGKHTPPLLIGKDKIPEVVERYVKSVKPMSPKDMHRPPFMHGFILGSIQKISYKAQVMIEDMLSNDHEMMSMEHEMAGMHDEMMGMDADMNEMMSMHHKMMGMKHDKHDSDCMDMHHMDHPDHMIEMEQDKHDPDYMPIHHMHYQIADEDTREHAHHMREMDEDNDENHEVMDMDHYMMDMHHKMMMNMEHEMAGTYDEMMGMDADMNEMMNMQHQIMDIDNEDTMQHSHYMHMDHKHEDDDENHKKVTCNCKHKISKDTGFEHCNTNYRIVSIDEILG
ncbi:MULTISPECIES: cell wall-binding repeat-containing protein [unclassified Clostridium]|uniref:cell wall-binding repeat-containing protein n=1 Tax=unclassified Clostridium TaxID=2614128 RepID=UPI00029741CF|nr:MULTISPECIES: cell wall-binding repeat-containing protein [unclassified Clostridium]EKQ51771.1 MAG: cell wall-binding protein [Clostridium sp. Maddingley MBC34-26]